MVADRMLSLREAAEYLGYEGDDALRRIVDRSRARVQGAAARGPTIKFCQVSRKSPIRFRREWLEDFVAEHTIDPSRAVVAAVKRTKKAASSAACSHWLN